MPKDRSGEYIRINKYGQEVKKRTFEFPTELLTEMREVTNRLRKTEIEFVIEAVRKKLLDCEV